MLTGEGFYRFRMGDIVWVKFDPNPAKYLEWFIADPGPFILGVFIFGYALDFNARSRINCCEPVQSDH